DSRMRRGSRLARRSAFFFSSRRRHTRSKRDWSSDVCSSDLPMSETHVITNQTKIIGFISMVEGYLAALFIDVAYQNNGAGKELLNFEKRRRNKIRLKVYKENLSAVRFYEKNGFIIKEE